MGHEFVVNITMWSDIKKESSRQIRTRQIIVQKMRGNVWAEQIIYRQGEFSLVNSKSIFVWSELSFENSGRLETIGITNYRDFSLQIRFHWKFDFFSSKSREFRRNTFALLLHNTVQILSWALPAHLGWSERDRLGYGFRTWTFWSAKENGSVFGPAELKTKPGLKWLGITVQLLHSRCKVVKD